MKRDEARVLGVVPARGGSKSIRRKNLKPLLGRPLIAYTISEAKMAKRLGRVIVSSEDDEILEVSRRYGAETPFIRPQELATDEALAIDVMRHAVISVEKEEGMRYDVAVMLQPTTPLRTAEDIDLCVEKLLSTGADSVISVVDVGPNHPLRMKTIEGDKLIDYEDETVENLPRQKLPPLYIRNGAIYATKRDVLIEAMSFKGKDCRAYLMPVERSVNIDDETDMALAEVLMKRRDWSYIRTINSIRLPWRAWEESDGLEITLPSEWRVTVAGMMDSREMTDDQISSAILSPIGTPRLSKMVKGDRSVCIAVDDLTKPTEAHRIIPALIEELEAGGIHRSEIYFLMSTGTHRALTHEDLVRKLGRGVVENFRIYNHSAYQNNSRLGETPSGTPVHIDNLFLQADVKIGIGTLMPHPYAGFSGGGKIVMPGLAGIESIDINHKPVNSSLQGKIGQVKGNSRREDIEEAAAMSGLGFIVDTISTSQGKTAGVFAGHPLKAFEEASIAATRVYATDVPYNVDVGIFNAFPRDRWFLLSLNALNVWGSRDADKEIVRRGGTIVIINACTEGVGEHGLVGKGMRHHVRRDKHGTFKGPLEGRRLIFFAPTINQGYIEDHYPEGVTVFQRWEDVCRELSRHHEVGTRVAIFPTASLQLDRNVVSPEGESGLLNEEMIASQS